MTRESELLAAAGYGQEAASMEAAQTLTAAPSVLRDGGRYFVRTVEAEDRPAVTEVFLVHESGNAGSDDWYDIQSADVLLREGVGWHLGDPNTGLPVDQPDEVEQVNAGGEAPPAENDEGAPPANPKSNRRGAGEAKE